MPTEMVALWPVLNRLQERARRLEEEAAALRADVEQVTRALDRPVATYVVDGEEFVITEGDVVAVRARLVKPRSEETVRELALIHKMAERHQDIPEAERERRFWENVEAIRAEAVAKGIAIDDPMEAVSTYPQYQNLWCGST